MILTFKVGLEASLVAANFIVTITPSSRIKELLLTLTSLVTVPTNFYKFHNYLI